MKIRHRRLFTILSTILVITALVLPVAVSADSVTHYRDRIVVPAGSLETYTLEVGHIIVNVPGEAMPAGGLLEAHLKEQNGEFTLRLSPEQDFASIGIDIFFGTDVEVISYFSRSESGEIVLDDGWANVDHCSRYSGYY